MLSLLANFGTVRAVHRAVRKGYCTRVFLAVAHVELFLDNLIIPLPTERIANALSWAFLPFAWIRITPLSELH